MAVTEEGRGHILYNDICGMEWGGVDIRNGGNPVVTNNWIRDGHADGIVIGEGGKGVIMDNDIRGKVLLVNVLEVNIKFVSWLFSVLQLVKSLPPSSLKTVPIWAKHLVKLGNSLDMIHGYTSL